MRAPRIVGRLGLTNALRAARRARPRHVPAAARSSSRGPRPRCPILGPEERRGIVTLGLEDPVERAAPAERQPAPRERQDVGHDHPGHHQGRQRRPPPEERRVRGGARERVAAAARAGGDAHLAQDREDDNPGHLDVAGLGGGARAAPFAAADGRRRRAEDPRREHDEPREKEQGAHHHREGEEGVALQVDVHGRGDDDHQRGEAEREQGADERPVLLQVTSEPVVLRQAFPSVGVRVAPEAQEGPCLRGRERVDEPEHQADRLARRHRGARAAEVGLHPAGVHDHAREAVAREVDGEGFVRHVERRLRHAVAVGAAAAVVADRAHPMVIWTTRRVLARRRWGRSAWVTRIGPSAFTSNVPPCRRSRASRGRASSRSRRRCSPARRRRPRPATRRTPGHSRRRRRRRRGADPVAGAGDIRGEILGSCGLAHRGLDMLPRAASWRTNSAPIPRAAPVMTHRMARSLHQDVAGHYRLLRSGRRLAPGDAGPSNRAELGHAGAVVQDRPVDPALP